jgi:hypothetical protein
MSGLKLRSPAPAGGTKLMAVAQKYGIGGRREITNAEGDWGFHIV